MFILFVSIRLLNFILCSQKIPYPLNFIQILFLTQIKNQNQPLKNLLWSFTIIEAANIPNREKGQWLKNLMNLLSLKNQEKWHSLSKIVFKENFHSKESSKLIHKMMFSVNLKIFSIKIGKTIQMILRKWIWKKESNVELFKRVILTNNHGSVEKSWILSLKWLQIEIFFWKFNATWQKFSVSLFVQFLNFFSRLDIANDFQNILSEFIFHF